MRKVYGFCIKDLYSYRLVLHHHLADNISHTTLRKIIFHEMKSLGFHIFICAFVVKRMVIAKKFSFSIKQILDSSNTSARNFDLKKQPACSCHRIKILGQKTVLASNHLWIKGTDVTLQCVHKVLTINGNTIPNDKHRFQWIEVSIAAEEMIKKLCTRGMFEKGQSNQSAMCENMDEYIPMSGKHMSF